MTAVSVLWGRRAGSRSLWLEDADSLRVGPTCHDINHQVPADHHSPSYGDLCYKQRAHRAQCSPCARRLHYLKCTGSRQFWAKAPWRVRWKLTSTIYAGQDFLGGPAVGKSICQVRVLKPVRPRAHALQQETPQQRQASAWQPESSPLSLQLEKAHKQQWRSSTVKNLLIFKKLFMLMYGKNHNILIVLQLN